MPKLIDTIRVTNELILLGTGTSVGVPAIGCGCEVCKSGHPRNQRTRTSALFGLPGGHLLIDTGPDLRTQLIREGIGLVHAVAYTHEHSDHVVGMDDLRLFQFYLAGPVPIYCTDVVEQRLREMFSYAFADTPSTHVGAVPALTMHRLSERPLSILGVEVRPIPLLHGPRFSTLGFRVGNVSYCTDVQSIPDAGWAALDGTETLIIDALRPTPHVTHMGVDEAIETGRKLGASRTILVHTSHELDYEKTNASLPSGVEMGYDGMRIPLGLPTAWFERSDDGI